jgi:hypothetical protein
MLDDRFFEAIADNVYESAADRFVTNTPATQL